MSPRRRMACLAAVAAVTMAAGCGSVAARGNPNLPKLAPPASLPGLATSMMTPEGSWGIAVLGGSAATHNDFWQLFTRPAGSSSWRLATPPGVASNGGLVAASPGSRSLVVAFRPSQNLAFTPLASTGDGGSSWSSGILDARLGNVPDALAAAPGGGRLLALLSGGRIDEAGRGAATWSRLSTLRSLAASPAGRRCAVTRLTAVAFSPSGAPVAAGTCTRAGASGIFVYTGGGWQPTGPVPPPTVGGRPLQVLRLTTTAAGLTALLAPTRNGSPSDLMAAWSRDGVHWTVSAPLASVAAAAGTVRAAGFSATGSAWALLAGGQAETVTPTAAGWRALPNPPRHTTLLAFGSPTSAGMDALATFGSKLTVWALTSSGSWRQAQTIIVPIQYGTSG